jgi:predicted 3-demethylubiquinone-9 3-methyltransferase (glyoxalase superfamily)
LPFVETNEGAFAPGVHHARESTREMTMSKIAPCLWFDGDAEEAASLYVSLLPGSRINQVMHAPADNPSTPAGAALLVDFEVAGQQFLGLNGGPQFKFSEAVSFTIHCDDQAEVDRLWDALTRDGGSPSQCGWLKDRFGVSWQIVPKAMAGLLGGPDREGSARAFKAMMQMDKIDIATLQRAYANT